ncbi:hypothetical protein [Paenirhodobacter populi]|uniref:hypothetical protein n=1 Tax=Paenirhodobacter populi TaxID=2306993 RepID=UPI000FE3190E|nr:hypothetical protein [Sinirhodobacter populi]RWR05616.1 hypothetical protein D2T32_16535 [Sinirhodobacter populi]
MSSNILSKTARRGLPRIRANQIFGFVADAIIREDRVDGSNAVAFDGGGEVGKPRPMPHQPMHPATLSTGKD